MSKFDTEERGVQGYFLPEDGQARLRTLQAHMAWLSRLPEPGAGEVAPAHGTDVPALAGGLALLAEEVQRVLDTLSWPARMAAKDVPTPVDGEGEDASDADAIAQAGDAGFSASAAQSPRRYVCAMTLDQLDDINRLLERLAAQGDLLAAGPGDFATSTIPAIGEALFAGANEVHGIIRDVASQRVEAGSRVREMPAVYGRIVGHEPSRLSRRAAAQRSCPAYGSGAAHLH